MTPEQARDAVVRESGIELSVAAVYRWIKTKKLRARRIGWRIFIARADLDAFLGSAA